MRIVIYIVIGVLCCVSATASSNHDNINKSPYSAKKRAKGRANNSNNYASKLSGEYVPETGPWSVEPTCEQLREMWRQSKRHSRAAEASNEIPQYVDPFARAYSRQMAVNPLATLRPRPERRPVIYGRLRESAVEEKPRPFDVLRRLNGQRITPSSVVDPSSAAVLLSEQDLSPFPKPSAKGSLQHLRELYREEQGPISGSKGAMDRLREQIREENRQTVAAPAWSTGDIGRVVTSPADHKYSLYGMQGDAPYSDANRARYNNNRLRQTDMTKIRNEQSFFDNGRISLTSQGGRSGGGGGGGGGGATTWKSRRHAPSPQDDDAIYERMDTQDEDEDTRYQAILQARRVSDPSTQNRIDCIASNGQRCQSHSDCKCKGMRRCHNGQCQAKKTSYPVNGDRAWYNGQDVAPWIEERRRRRITGPTDTDVIDDAIGDMIGDEGLNVLQEQIDEDDDQQSE